MVSKLYLVTCRGMQTGVSASPAHGVAYVIAKDPAEAYAKLRSDLDTRDLGFNSDRELDTIRLLAEAREYPECGTQLYL